MGNNRYDVDNVLPLNERAERTVGILGGSFDPPHLGHVYMALSVLQRTEMDELWVTPCDNHVFKEDLADFRNRRDMCRLAFRHLNRVKTTIVENVLPQPNYTVKTLRAIHETRPNLELYFVVGADLVEEIPDWTQADGLTDLCQLLVVPRQGHPAVDPPPEVGDPTFVELSCQLPEMSSTTIRRLVRQGADASGFLDDLVHQYIENRELYSVD